MTLNARFADYMDESRRIGFGKKERAVNEMEKKVTRFPYIEMKGAHAKEFFSAIEELKSYRELGTVEEFVELKQAESEGRIIPKEAHQPSFVKYDAVDIFDQWNDTTGALDKGTSWYCEIQSIIEEVAAMAFGAGAIYQSEASAALAEMEERENEIK